MKIKSSDQILLEQAYLKVRLNEQEGEVVTQEQLTELYKKGKPLQFSKNTPVALATVEELKKSLGEEKTKQVLALAGAVDETSYNKAWKKKGYVVFQWNSEKNEPDIYIADPRAVKQNYSRFQGSLPTDEKAVSKIPSLVVLKHLGIESSKLPFFVKHVPTNMISADEVGLAGRRIAANFGEQTVKAGGFLVKEDNGHIYTVAPDSQGLPIGYVKFGSGSAVSESVEGTSNDVVEELFGSLKRTSAKEQIKKMLEDQPELIEGIRKYKETDPKGYQYSIGNFETNGIWPALLVKLSQGKSLGMYDWN